MCKNEKKIITIFFTTTCWCTLKSIYLKKFPYLQLIYHTISIVDIKLMEGPLCITHLVGFTPMLRSSQILSKFHMDKNTW